MTVGLPFFTHAQDNSSASTLQAPPDYVANCSSSFEFSDVTYEDLRSKLEVTLREKNKSLILLEFRGLQAQIDVIVNHLTVEENLDQKMVLEILEKNLSYIEQLEKLMGKAKENAKTIKDDHVIPLASLTSLKSESDKCFGIDSQYLRIFKTLSQLNKDFNEILMMSPQKLVAQREKVKSLLRQTQSGKIKISSQIMNESFNVMQTHINIVTQTFEFDSSRLQIASH